MIYFYARSRFIHVRLISLAVCLQTLCHGWTGEGGTLCIKPCRDLDGCFSLGENQIGKNELRGGGGHILENLRRNSWYDPELASHTDSGSGRSGSFFSGFSRDEDFSGSLLQTEPVSSSARDPTAAARPYAAHHDHRNAATPIAYHPANRLSDKNSAGDLDKNNRLSSLSATFVESLSDESLSDDSLSDDSLSDEVAFFQEDFSYASGSSSIVHEWECVWTGPRPRVRLLLLKAWILGKYGANGGRG